MTTKQLIKHYYDMGTYTQENVATFVEAGIITIDDYNEIVKSTELEGITVC